MSGDSSETINVRLHDVSIAVLELKPNQTLVIQQRPGSERLKREQKNAICDQIKAVIGRADARIMFLPDGIDLGVIEA